ncbi:hypothetical protein NPA07_00450 [Mycoplasmopsis caviae]|uniref:Lipoprotein-associated type-17 domain-containing protein n=1 Tax=Mycoplasmopsis caviae TaxID=55603 RepID=A0A3P8MEK4_9BACT|nr:hypothetical protein [Mycoplasmopsis caviae]UUD35335.1 hypothetical protein NPA07_00450 [Mycoplasmopsis caviae]VDR41886.1 Uncharacterised protein [Mycoplasmopsis caviae]
MKNKKISLLFSPVALSLASMPVLSASCTKVKNIGVEEINKKELNELAKKVEFSLKELTKEQIIKQGKEALEIKNIDPLIEVVVESVSLVGEGKISISYHVKQKTKPENKSGTITVEKDYHEPLKIEELNKFRDAISIKAKGNLYAYEIVEKKEAGLEKVQHDPKVGFKIISIEETSGHESVKVTYLVFDSNFETNISETKETTINAKKFPDIEAELKKITVNFAKGKIPKDNISKENFVFSKYDKKIFEITDFKGQKNGWQYTFYISIKNKFTNKVSTQRQFILVKFN